jgi:hypothetical protein
MAMSPRLLRPRATGTGFDSSATAYIAAVELADGEPLELLVKKAISDFVRGCKADGIWTAIKASCLLMGARTLAGALTPLVGSAPTNNGPFVTGDYNRETGLIGNGSTKYLDSARNNNASPQDNAHLAAFVGEAIVGDASTRALIGTSNATGSSALIKSSSGNVLQTRLKHITASSSPTSMAGYSGFVGASRSDSASYLTRISGANSTVSIASSANQDASVLVYALTPAAITGNMRLSFYSIGEKLDLALLDARVSALSTAIGAAI